MGNLEFQPNIKRDYVLCQNGWFNCKLTQFFSTHTMYPCSLGCWGVVQSRFISNSFSRFETDRSQTLYFNRAGFLMNSGNLDGITEKILCNSLWRLTTFCIELCVTRKCVFILHSIWKL